MKKLLPIALSLLLCNCATILKGSNQPLNVNSNVDGANVFVNSQKVGTTPFTGSIERQKSIRLKVSKAGYKSRTLVLDSDIEGVFWVNIFSGGGWGSTTDFATGSMWKVSPNIYNLDLVKKE